MDEHKRTALHFAAAKVRHRHRHRHFHRHPNRYHHRHHYSVFDKDNDFLIPDPGLLRGC